MPLRVGCRATKVSIYPGTQVYIRDIAQVYFFSFWILYNIMPICTNIYFHSMIMRAYNIHQKERLMDLRIFAIVLSAAWMVGSRADGGCVLPNCLECTEDQQCTMCPDRLSCCQLECTTCVAQTQCLGCQDNFVLGSDQLCRLNNSCWQVGCADCSNDACILCLSGFALNPITRECLLCGNQCMICTPDTLTCLQCQSGYYLSQQNTCQNCNNPLTLLGPCQICPNISLCQSCFPGYGLNGQFYCQACSTGCKLCQSNQKCFECNPGYFLTNSQSCSKCSTSCVYCNHTATNCTLCSGDSYYQNGTCTLCASALPFCLACAFVDGRLACLTCDKRMYLEGNVCLLCPQGCAMCNSSSVCTKCNANLYLSDSKCLPCQIGNCVTCINSSPRDCFYCMQQYSPSSQICQKCPPNCLQCISTTTCSQCVDTGYHLVNGTCVACAPNVAKCQVVGRVFQIQCAYKFYQLRGLCLPCPLYCLGCGSYQPQCSPGYFGANGFCAQCLVTNCYDCGVNGTTCSMCVGGYYLANSTQCLPCSPNCQICLDPIICQQCQPGFYLLDNICQPCLSNCLSCQSPNTCLQCSQGFYKNGNSTLCFNCPSECLECGSAVSCQVCRVGYYYGGNGASGTGCFPCVWPCVSCRGSGNRMCMLCAINYRLGQQGCIRCDQGCISCVSNGDCQLCEQGYALAYSNKRIICQKCPSGCHQCESIIHPTLNQSLLSCQSCGPNPLSLLLPNQSCFTCGSNTATSGCQTCLSTTQCQSCFPGFKLNSSMNCVNVVQVVWEIQWKLVWVGIGLGVLVMVLLVVLLEVRRQGKRSEGEKV